MRFVVYGAGAVGGTLGALLHAAGEEVALVARGQHLAAIRADGLRLESPAGSQVLAVPAISPAEITPGTEDVVLLAVKSDATESVVRDLATGLPADTPLVCVQNGVANERLALRYFEHVYGVCVMMPTTYLEPGVVQAHSAPTPAILDLGRYPKDVDDTCTVVAKAFDRAGCVSEPRPDILRWKFRKLLMNLGNAVQAVCAREDGYDELRAMVDAEGNAALAAAGIDVASAEEDRARRGDILQVTDFNDRPRSGSSSWQSLQRRTGSIEADYLNGEIVLLGRLYGVPTPANELLRRIANDLARSSAAPGTVPPERLLSALR